MGRRRFCQLRSLALPVSLLLLYLALPGISPSSSGLMLASAVFEAAQPVSQQQLAAAGSVLRFRLQLLSVPGASWSVSSSGDARLVVLGQAGGAAEQVLAAASQVGHVEVVDGGTEFLTVGSRVKTGPQPLPDQGVYEAVLDADQFMAAEAGMGASGRPVIKFSLTPAGDAHLARHTGQQPGYYLCLVVDQRVVNCPILYTPLVNRQGVIELTGDASLDQAHQLAVWLRSGPLPVALRPAGD
jgi:preprotein translocase subunit SecD